MNTCQMCRFWTRNVEEEFSPDSAVFGTCASPKLAYGRTSGRKQTVDYAIYPADRSGPPGERQKWVHDMPVSQCTDMLLYQDYSSYDAMLETGENFGCIHWEAAAT